MVHAIVVVGILINGLDGLFDLTHPAQQLRDLKLFDRYGVSLCHLLLASSPCVGALVRWPDVACSSSPRMIQSRGRNIPDRLDREYRALQLLIQCAGIS